MAAAGALKARARRLVATANELLAVARDLEALAEAPGNVAHLGVPNLLRPVMLDQPYWLELAKRSYRDRRRRSRFFDSSLFGEAGWDILLDLFISAKSDKKVPITSACIAAAVPPTTALRWITVLESQGLVVRSSDPDDARRYFLHLTPHGYSQLCDYFSDQMSTSDVASWPSAEFAA